MGCNCGGNSDKTEYVVSWSATDGSTMTKTVTGELFAKAEAIGKLNGRYAKK